jgi:hypothetical protein
MVQPVMLRRLVLGRPRLTANRMLYMLRVLSELSEFGVLGKLGKLSPLSVLGELNLAARLGGLVEGRLVGWWILLAHGPILAV